MDKKTNSANTDNDAKKKQPTGKKIRIIVAFLIMCVLGGLGYIASENPAMFTTAYWKSKTGADEPTSMYSNKITSYDFYPSDYAEDIYSDNVYVGLNRYLQYKNGAETVTVTNGNYSDYGDVPAFFGAYFETVIAGDADTYNTYFTDAYYESNEPYDRFTAQKLYDITVTLLSTSVSDDGVTTYACNVAYCIRRNNGTFRNDIGSDASKTLYFELVTNADGLKINRITYYVR